MTARIALPALLRAVPCARRKAGCSYNDAQQISGMDETIVSSLRRFTYTYDGRDQLTAETEWEYDPDGWIEGPPYSYSYDQAQNRMSRSKTGVGSESYAYTIANKLTNIYLGSTSANNRYFYDRAGNLEYRVVNNVTNWYDYNAQNKLARIRGAGFTNEFVYDAQHRRVALCQNGTWRYEAHDGALPVGSFGQDRQVQNWCVRGVGIAEGTGDVMCEVDMSGAGAQPYYYLCNHRGDTLVVLNSSGTVTARMRYDAFGNMYDVSTNSVYFPRYTFSTKEYLSQPKLYLYAYRVYDPVAGRWTQRDPIDYQDSLNLYQFCGNNPVSRQDPAGLAVIDNQTPDPIEVEGGPGVLQGHDGPSEKATLPPGQSIGRDSPKTGDAGGAITDADRINGTRVSGDDLFPVITVKGYVEIMPGYYMPMPGGKTVYELNVIGTVLGAIQSGAERLGNWLGGLSTRFF